MFWNAVKSCTNVDEVRVYLEKFSKGRTTHSGTP